ncbi:hypothetical protein HQ563_01515 [bacterium]|nr:hypothetical protein [bacterium]
MNVNPTIPHLALLTVSTLCLCSGCDKKEEAWVCLNKLSIGYVPNRTANQYDVCLVGDGVVAVPHIYPLAAGPEGTGGREANFVMGRVAIIRESQGLQVVAITQVQEVSPEGPEDLLSCACCLDANDDVAIILGLQKFRLVELDLRGGASPHVLETTEVPIRQGVVLMSLLIGSGKSLMAFVSMSLKIDGEREGRIQGILVGDRPTPLEIPSIGGFFDAVTYQDGVLLAAIAAFSEGGGLVVRFFKVASSNERWSVQASNLPDLVVPGRVRGLRLICNRKEPLVLVAGDFVIYECYLSDGEWELSAIAREDTVFSAFAAARLGNRPCVVYSTYYRKVKALVRAAASRDWTDYDLSSAFGRPVYDIRLLAYRNDRLCMVSSEGDTPPDRHQLIFREWQYKTRGATQE